jgi:hypothetical protein
MATAPPIPRRRLRVRFYYTAPAASFPIQADFCLRAAALPVIMARIGAPVSPAVFQSVYIVSTLEIRSITPVHWRLAMTRLLLFALAVWCWGFPTTAAHALGADHPKGPVAGNDQWPRGLKELVHRPDRVHGYWVNETDVFFYHGDSQQFNQFIDGYRQLQATTLRVVIHAGTQKARSPWDKADREIPVAWTLHASFSRLDRFGAGLPRWAAVSLN